MTFTLQQARDLVRCAKAENQQQIISLGRSESRIKRMRQLYEFEECLKHLSLPDPNRRWTAVRHCEFVGPADGEELLRVDGIVPLRLLDFVAPETAATLAERGEGTANDAMHLDCPRCAKLFPLVAHRTPAGNPDQTELITVSVICLNCLELAPVGMSG